MCKGINSKEKRNLYDFRNRQSLSKTILYIAKKFTFINYPESKWYRGFLPNNCCCRSFFFFLSSLSSNLRPRSITKFVLVIRFVSFILWTSVIHHKIRLQRGLVTILRHTWNSPSVYCQEIRPELIVLISS